MIGTASNFPGPTSPVFPVILAAAVLLAALLPPEVHGEALAGVAVIILLLALLAGDSAEWPHGSALLATAGAVAIPVARAADAPGSAVEPVAIALLTVAAILASAALIPGTRNERVVPMVLIVAGAAVGIHAVVQQVWGLEAMARWLENNPSFPEREVLLARVREGRAYAGFATPAALAGYLALCLPVTVAVVAARGGFRRVVVAAALVAQLGGFLAAASATAVGSLLLAAAGALVLSRRDERRRWFLVGACALAALLVVLFVRGGSLLSFSDPSSPWRLRAGNARVAVAIIADSPWAGVGPGGFAEAFPRHREAAMNETQHAHCLPLELMAEVGIPAGLGVSAIFFIVFLGPLWQWRGGLSWQRGAVVGLAAFALQNLADFTAFLPSVAWTAALLRGSISRGPGATGESRVWPAQRALGLSVVGLAAIVAALSALGSEAAYRSRLAAASGDPVSALEEASRAVDRAPWEPDHRILLAQSLLSVSESPEPEVQDRLATAQRALGEADRAVALAPVRPSARGVRARARVLLGDLPGALADLDVARELYPMKEAYRRECEALRERLTADTGSRDGR